MTKSRKLVIAAVLLAGGYGVACFLGAPSKSGSHAGTRLVTAEAPGVFSTLRELALGHKQLEPIGQLAPDHGFAARVPANSTALVPQQMMQHPTWLDAKAPSRAALPAIEPPKLADSAALAESRPIATIAEKLADPAAAPRARVTNVVVTSTDSNERNASTWDRWPWWDSKPASTLGNSAGSPVASALQQRSNTVATTASFNGIVPLSNFASTQINSEFDGAADLPLTAEGRTHVVVDGDSLSKLADRYLDDAELGEEIYRLNQDVLGDPELLPIGVELRIPENRFAVSGQRLAGTIGLQAANTGPPPAGMVPVEWKPRPFDAEPRAQLLRPVPAGRNE